MHALQSLTTKPSHRVRSDAPALVGALWCAGVVAIDAGDDHSVALAADGRVWTWGCGKDGALGHDTMDSQTTPKLVEALRCSPVVSVAAGGAHTVALSTKGRVYSWGCNCSGQLGVGNRIDASSPCVMEESHTLQIFRVRARRVALRCAPQHILQCFCSACSTGCRSGAAYTEL
jgi:alpha-tubulin suppressor-like RCC1 family protein